MSEIQKAFKRQKDSYLSGAVISHQRRIESLKKLYLVVKDNMEDIHKALNKDLGKSETESYITETSYVLGDIKYTIKNLAKWMKPKRARGGFFQFPSKSYVINEPLGVSLIIGPWNYPFQLIFSPLVAAIAAGNRVILKPSEMAAETSKIVLKLINENFESSEIKAIEGGVETASTLLELPFDKIFFTGGTAVGKIVMEKAAKNLTPVTLELGGKSPCIVWECKNVDLAARRIVWGKFFNAGQTCIAPDYILVSRDQELELIESLKKYIKIHFGEDVKTSKDYGRIINHKHFDRLLGLISSESIIFGGESKREEKFLGPTLLRSQENCEVMKDEIFGPLLPILTFESFEEVKGMIKSKPKPLALYGFTSNSFIEKEIVNELSAGGVCMNDTLMHFSHHKLPFGGVGESGIGSYHGEYGFREFSHQKAYMKRYYFFDLVLRYPPFTLKKTRLLKKIMALIG